MSEPKRYAKVTWCWEDIKALRPSWSRGQCIAAIRELEKHLRDAMIQTGWEVLNWELDK